MLHMILVIFQNDDYRCSIKSCEKNVNHKLRLSHVNVNIVIISMLRESGHLSYLSL